LFKNDTIVIGKITKHLSVLYDGDFELENVDCFLPSFPKRICKSGYLGTIQADCYGLNPTNKYFVPIARYGVRFAGCPQ
jgi:hypothetical protein